MIIGLKMWPLEREQGFSKIWPSDLVFYPMWPIFKLVRDFISENILTKFHDYRTGNEQKRGTIDGYTGTFYNFENGVKHHVTK